ncbi:MAG TPA: hypothetical protein VGK19_19085 [Capsulimonadaceae bacterium]|jgi:hypothetical protein
MEAGFARRDITPNVGVQLFGYGRVRLAETIGDRLAVSVLVLRDGDRSAAIVSMDICLIGEDDVAAIRKEIASSTGIPAPNVTLCCTHTHSAPVPVNCWGWGERDAANMDLVSKQVCEAVREASASTVSVKVGVGATHSNVGINRRQVKADGAVVLGSNSWGVYDPALTVVRFEAASGPVAQLVNVGAHPTARGADSAISRDWPGVMVDRVEAITHAPVVFINGTAGDIAPRSAFGGAVGDSAPAATEVGLLAAGDAIRAWHSIRDFRNVNLDTVTTTIQIPLDPLPDPTASAKRLAELPDADPEWGAVACERKHLEAVQAAEKRELMTQRPIDVTVTKIGPTAIVPLPGEVFTEIGLRIKQDSAYEHTLIASTSNGNNGYFVTQEARARGGYEVWVAKAYGAYLPAAATDDALVQGALSLLTQIP